MGEIREEISDDKNRGSSQAGGENKIRSTGKGTGKGDDESLRNERYVFNHLRERRARNRKEGGKRGPRKRGKISLSCSNRTTRAENIRSQEVTGKRIRESREKLLAAKNFMKQQQVLTEG